MNTRELIWNVFHNEPAERVPVGFWFHFAPDEMEDVFENPALRAVNIEGHRRFVESFRPDILKIMTDGYFCYPNEAFNRAETAADLRGMTAIGPDHPWIREQVRLARELTGAYGADTFCVYNLFSPATLFKFARKGARKRAGVADPDQLLADFIVQDRAAVAGALETAARDIAALAEAVIREGGADGVYYSVQDVADPRIGAGEQAACVRDADFAVLDAARRAGGTTVLHICSYAGHHNDVARYTDYPAEVINWAAALEHLPLGAGKRLFRGRPVIGGFDNSVEGVLYRGSREEIEAETARLLAESGRRGVMLGADCTIPRDTAVERLRWAREAAR